MPNQAEAQLDASQENQSYKIKVEGKEIELTYDQLVEMAQKGADYTKKTQALSEKEKKLESDVRRSERWREVDEKITTDPQLAKTLEKVYSDYASGKISKSDDVRDRNLKLLDKRLEEAADPEDRKTLKQVRQIILEETNVDELREEMKLLKDQISFLQSSSAASRTETIGSQINEMSPRFGKDIVEKYAEDIKGLSLKYPKYSAEEIFLKFADKADVKSALLTEVAKEKEQEIKRKQNGSMPGGDGSTVAVDAAKFKDKHGRVNFSEMFKSMKAAGKFNQP